MSWWEPSRTWRSGSWSLQVGQGALEQISFGQHLVLRGIRAVVRDHDWATADLHLDQVEEVEDSLDLAVHTSGLSARLSGHLRVRARGADLNVDLDLHSDGDLATNRTGLVVLHPPGLAGAEAQVTHPGGETEQSAFPVSISPHQPMRDIRGLQWACGGAGVQAWFEGDAFEMEDQRNWSDASYKTYSRPLELPFPYQLRAGQRVHQRVRVHVWDRVWNAARGGAAAYDGGRDAGVGEGALGEGAERGSGRDAAVVASDPAHPDGAVRGHGAARADGSQRSATFECAGSGAAPDAAAHSKAPDLIELHPGAPFPDLQLGASTAPDPAPALPRKRAAGPGAPLPRKRAGGPDEPGATGAARVVELDLGSPAWPAALERAARAGLPLDVRLVLTEESVAGGEVGEPAAAGEAGEPASGGGTGEATAGGEGTELHRAVRMLREIKVLRICAHQGAGPAEHMSDAAAVEALRSALESAGLEATVVGGARSHFTEY